MNMMIRNAGAAVLIGLAGAAAHAQTPGNAPVTIDLRGVKAGTGDLYVSLQTRDQFMRPTGAYGTIVPRPAGGSRVVTLAGVAPGEYAASVWHDVNGNRKWDSDERGIPVDGWAMLNGDTLRAKPTFAQVSFTHGAAPRTLTLGMKYGK